MGSRTVALGAEVIALLPDDGPTGTYSDRKESFPVKAGFEFGSWAVAGSMPTENIPCPISKTPKGHRDERAAPAMAYN